MPEPEPPELRRRSRRREPPPRSPPVAREAQPGPRRAYVTFGRTAEREETPAPKETPVVAEAPVAEMPVAEAPAPVLEPPVPPEPAPEPTSPPAASTYVTFGAAAPQPVVEEESPAPEPTAPSLHDATVAPQEAVAPAEAVAPEEAVGPQEAEETEERDDRTVAPSTVPVPPEAVEPAPETVEPEVPGDAAGEQAVSPGRRFPVGAAVAVLVGAAIIAGVVGVSPRWHRLAVAPGACRGSPPKPEPLAQTALGRPDHGCGPGGLAAVSPPTSIQSTSRARCSCAGRAPGRRDARDRDG